MQRTITLKVDVSSADDYAAVVAALVTHPLVKHSAWTRGEEVKDILESKYGMGVRWGEGSVHDGFGLRGSK